MKRVLDLGPGNHLREINGIEQSRKPNTKVTEATQVLGSQERQSIEVGTGTNDRSSIELQEDFNDPRSALVDRLLEESRERRKGLLEQLNKERENKEIAEISTAIKKAEQKISHDLNEKGSILSNLLEKTISIGDSHPAKKIAFEFLHTQAPKDKDIFYRLGKILEMQDPKAARQLYVNGLSKDELFEEAALSIKSIIKEQEDLPTTLALKPIFDIDVFFDPPAVIRIKTQLNDLSNSIHADLKKFVQEENKKEKDIIVAAST